MPTTAVTIIDQLLSTQTLNDRLKAERAAAEAAAAADVDPVNAAAASVLGMKVREIADVEPSADGVVITTIDGVRMIAVPDDRPDGAACTGIMFLDRDHPGYRHSILPVFTPHPDVDDVPVAALAASAVPVPPCEPETSPEVRAPVERVGATVDLDTSRGVRKRQLALPNLVAGLEERRRRATSVEELAAIDTELTALAREEQVLPARLRSLARAESERAEAARVAAEEADDARLAALMLEADQALFAPILALHRGFHARRAAALEAGTTRARDVVEELATARSARANGGHGSVSEYVSAFALVDQLAAYLSGEWQTSALPWAFATAPDPDSNELAQPEVPRQRRRSRR